MATLAQRGAGAEGTRFYTIMAFVMALVIVAGFSLNLAMGRSSFALPAAFHVHGMIFMGWLGLYLAQAVTIASGNRALHRQLGKLAYVFIPAMVAAGAMIIVVSIRGTGGPFFFAQNEFFISNLAGLLVFGGLAWWALRVRRHTGWHRRLMLVAMSALTGPGLGRLLPMPLLIPYAWPIAVAASFVFGAVAMLVDWNQCRRLPRLDGSGLFAHRLCHHRSSDRRHTGGRAADGAVPAAGLHDVGRVPKLFARKSEASPYIGGS
jgi:hypothetical protein